MFGHLLPAFSNVAPLELPLLAATAASTWWIIGIAFTLIACGSTYGYLRRQKKSAAKPAPAPQTRTPVRSPFDELVEAHKLDDVVKLPFCDGPSSNSNWSSRSCSCRPESLGFGFLWRSESGSRRPAAEAVLSPAGVEQSDSDHRPVQFGFAG